MLNFMMGKETFLNVTDDGFGGNTAGQEDESVSRGSIYFFENKPLLLP